jgi:protocatechuate 3,4-dioxygenase beta subunit
MRKRPLGLVLVVLLILLGIGVAVYVVTSGDTIRPVSRAKQAETEPAPPANGRQLTPGNTAPEQPGTQPAPTPAPGPEPEPEPKQHPEPGQQPKSPAEQLGFPKPHDFYMGLMPGETADGVAVPAFGTVVDQDGKPVAGANIVLSIVYTTDEGQHVVDASHAGSSGRDGTFSVRVLYKPRDIGRTQSVVTAVKSGYFLSSIVETSATSPREIVLHELSADTQVEGDVVDEDGAPAAGVQVRAAGTLDMLDPDALRVLSADAQAALQASATRPWRPNATTDENGHFVFKSVPPGSLKVWVGGDNVADSVELAVYEGRRTSLSRPLTAPSGK